MLTNVTVKQTVIMSVKDSITVSGSIDLEISFGNFKETAAYLW